MATTATNTISGGIKWTGLASQTDFGSVVEAMVAVERRVITKQETWKSQWEEKLEAINKLDTQLGTLKAAATDYGTRDKLLSRKATSSDEKVVTVTNTSTAATGSYTVEVAEEVNEIKSSRSFKTGQDIGMNYKTNAKGQPVDKYGNVLAVTSWNVDSAMALLGMKLPAGTDFPLSFDSQYNQFKDANGQVVARYDLGTNSILDPDGNKLFGLQSHEWVVETALSTLAYKLGTTNLPLTYDDQNGRFYDSTNTLVAELNGDDVCAPGDPDNKFFTLGEGGISTTWETDSALAVLSQRFSANPQPLRYDPDTLEFLDNSGVTVAKLDPSTNEIYNPDDRDDIFHTMSRRNMTNWGDPNILKFLEEHADIPGSVARPFFFDAANDQYFASNGNLVADLDTVTGNIILPGSNQVVAHLDSTGRLLDAKSNEPIISSDTSRHYYGPMTFTMNGKTLELEYDPTYDPATDGIKANVFSENCSMEELCEIINASVNEAGYTGPAIKAEIVYDKTRQETVTNDDGTTSTHSVVYNRLRIIGQESGSENRIEIYDPTNLCLDENAIDEPIKTQWVGSTAQPVVSADSKYTGHVNKTITFVISEGGRLGEDAIKISWADTENKGGTFTIEPDHWDSLNGCLKKDVEIIQGLKVNFNLGTQAGGNQLSKDNAFTIDCQAPTVQKAADSGMAQSDKWVHQGFSSLTLPVHRGSGGKFDFSYAGMDYSIPIKDLTTLSGLAEAINSSNKNPGVIASVLNDGMGTATSYKLVLTGAHSGSEHEIRVLDTTNLSGVSMKPETFEHARTATNSMCRIDGYPSDGISWIQRQSNEVGDVLDGTVLQLEGTGKATINIVNNVTEMADKIKQIISSVNITISYIQEQTRYAGGKFTVDILKDGTIQRKTEGTASGVMIGNYGFQISNSEIKNIMSSQIFTMDEYITAIDPDKEKQGLLPREEKKKLYEAYLEENGLIYTRLSDIGIAFDAKATDDYSKDGGGVGAYVIEESKLTEALRKNPEAVIKLFTFKPDDTFKEYIKYADEDPRPTLSGGVLSKMFYSMSDLTRSGDVYDKKTGDMIQPAKGIMRVLSENYTKIISGINDKIAREEKRVALKQERLEEKFNRLEVLIGQLNQQSENLQAELDKLSK